jgi:hypothetical protein
MADEYPEHLVDLQRRVHAAWAEVEAHRKDVDAERQADPRAETKLGPALREWTTGEDAEHARLLGEATQAAGALRQALADAGLGHGYDVVQGLHKAARA